MNGILDKNLLSRKLIIGYYRFDKFWGGRWLHK